MSSEQNKAVVRRFIEAINRKITAPWMRSTHPIARRK